MSKEYNTSNNNNNNYTILYKDILNSSININLKTPKPVITPLIIQDNNLDFIDFHKDYYKYIHNNL